MRSLLVLALALALLLVPLVPARGEDPAPLTSGDYQYIVLEDGTVEITRYAGWDEALAIPDTLDGKTVSRIGDKAFHLRSSLTSLTLPDSVTSIGNQAFSFCGSLTNLTIPDSVTSIGDGAFEGCTGLTDITIPDSVTAIGANPFARCTRLTDIRVSPDHPALAVIDGVLFSKADKRLVSYPCAFTAESYAIPQGIKAIGDFAFSWCYSLTSITIPDSVTSIGDNAFFGCNNLTSITIPDSVTAIGDSAFADCATTLTLTVPRNSYAEQYCKDNSLAYTHPNAPD